MKSLKEIILFQEKQNNTYCQKLEEAHQEIGSLKYTIQTLEGKIEKPRVNVNTTNRRCKVIQLNPTCLHAKNNLESLEEYLNKCIQQENYEEAAIVSNKLKRI